MLLDVKDVVYEDELCIFDRTVNGKGFLHCLDTIHLGSWISYDGVGIAASSFDFIDQKAIYLIDDIFAILSGPYAKELIIYRARNKEFSTFSSVPTFQPNGAVVYVPYLQRIYELGGLDGAVESE